MSIAVVIVNYRTPELVCECLDSLAAERASGPTFEAFVGDALSGDGSVEIIAEHIRLRDYDWALCFDIGANDGFAAGNNAILQRCVLDRKDFSLVHFLNPDTYVRPGAVGALASCMARHIRSGVVGSRLENPDGSPRAYGFRFPTPVREFFRGAQIPKLDRYWPSTTVKINDLEERRQVDWVTGASFMVRRSVLDDVGTMDPGYFLYFEEVDFMFRVRKAGYEIWHEPESKVVHLAGQSTGVQTNTVQRRPMPAYWFQSRWKFFADNYGKPAAVLANVLFFLGDLLYRLHRLIRFKRPVTEPSLWRSYLHHGFSMPPERPRKASS